MKRKLAILAGLAALCCRPAFAELEKPETTYKIFQFPADKIPRIDGDASDWAMVPDSYSIGMDQMHDDSNRLKAADPKNLDAKVKVGWVKGENRLYFLYEAFDDYWDFSLPTLHNDTFEIVVDGDLSGGPLIAEQNPNTDIMGGLDAAFLKIQGTQAQNYHIFVPAAGKDWCMCWNAAQWLKRLPYANVAYNYTVKSGEAGKVTMEFFITPFDYASYDGPGHSVESQLKESNLIGLAWAMMDYDDATKEAHTFWNLSPKHTMYGNASQLVKFKLEPLDPALQKPIDAEWSFKVIDMDRRMVAFQDESVSTGKITSWSWDFGDGEKSTEQHPIHQYKKVVQPEKPAKPKPDRYVVVLEIEGEKGKARMSKVWDVSLK